MNREEEQNKKEQNEEQKQQGNQEQAQPDSQNNNKKKKKQKRKRRRTANSNNNNLGSVLLHQGLGLILINEHGQTLKTTTTTTTTTAAAAATTTTEQQGKEKNQPWQCTAPRVTRIDPDQQARPDTQKPRTCQQDGMHTHAFCDTPDCWSSGQRKKIKMKKKISTY